MEHSLQRMKELVEKLDQAAKAYYQEDREIMSNQEYDSLYDQLEQLEKETGTVLTNSPTVRVGYEAVNELPKEEHPSPMLSLDKTKDREVLRGFIGNHKCLLSWKLDGLTRCADISQRCAGKSSHARKRRGRRSHYEQRARIPEYSAAYFLSG